MDKVNKVLRFLGPGLVTGASDDDPSGIGTYSQTGAQFGYQQLWLSLFSIPFMIAIQEMCGRIGFVTGHGLAGVLRKYYPKPIVYGSIVLLLLANSINIGADLGAMASSAQLLIALPFPLWLIIAALVSTGLLLYIPYKKYVVYLKYISIALFAYIITAFIVKTNWTAALHATIVPSITFTGDYLLNIVALLGTTISPYLFFWQSNEEVEERIVKGRQQSLGRKVGNTTKKDIWKLEGDTVIGMIFSNIIAFFVILTCASTLNMQGIHTVSTAAQAAQALKPIAGNYTFLLFAIGIIGGGLLAVPVLAGSVSYAISEVYQHQASINKKPSDAKFFYGIIVFTVIIGILINFSPIPPFKLLYYSAALNGILAAPLMVLIILIARNKTIMKEHTNTLLSTILGWAITFIMSLGTVALLVSFIHK